MNNHQLDKQILHIIIANYDYCLPISDIVVIKHIALIRPEIKREPGYVGKINYQGKMLAVIDAAQFLGLRDQSCYDLNSPMILCKFQSQEFVLLVDEVVGVIELEELDSQLQGDIIPFDMDQMVKIFFSQSI